MTGAFFVDGGAMYTIKLNDDGQIAATGSNTGTVYTGAGNRIVVTGRVRRQGARVGRDARGVLHLDTGEGIAELPGAITGELAWKLLDP